MPEGRPKRIRKEEALVTRRKMLQNAAALAASIGLSGYGDPYPSRDAPEKKRLLERVAVVESKVLVLLPSAAAGSGVLGPQWQRYYTIHITFDDGMQGEFLVEETVARNLRVGSHITIYYYPQPPERGVVYTRDIVGIEKP